MCCTKGFFSDKCPQSIKGALVPRHQNTYNSSNPTSSTFFFFLFSAFHSWEATQLRHFYCREERKFLKKYHKTRQAGPIWSRTQNTGFNLSCKGVNSTVGVRGSVPSLFLFFFFNSRLIRS